MGGRTVSTERNKAIIRRVFEDGVSRGDWAVIDEAFSQRNVDYPVVEPLPPERIKEFLDEVRTLLPDLQVEIQHLVAEGEIVTTIERWGGTSKVTGERAQGTVFHLFRFEDGQIVEEWSEGFSWLDELAVRESELRTEDASQPLHTTRTWTFKSGNGEQGRAVLERLHHAATSIPGVSVHLFQDQTVTDRFVTVGVWPSRAAFQAYRDHPDMVQVQLDLRALLAEAYPSDGAILMQELVS